jgi:hypothetical protein
VNIPLSTVHPVDPASLNDQQLRQRIRELADRLMTMDRKSVDYQQVSPTMPGGSAWGEPWLPDGGAGEARTHEL